MKLAINLYAIDSLFNSAKYKPIFFLGLVETGDFKIINMIRCGFHWSAILKIIRCGCVQSPRQVRKENRCP